jgi:RimJ/RimL family protein N-acetyltransferase
MIETARLILRPWTEADVAGFMHATNTSAVMEYLGGVALPETFVQMFARVQASQRENGFCFWLMHQRGRQDPLGFCGFKIGNVGPIDGKMEIGWRLREDAWGKGYACEAAGACLDWAWRNLDVAEIFAITVPGNTRSWGLMERLGMRRRTDLDFDHPAFSPGHALRSHITYAIAREDGARAIR